MSISEDKRLEKNKAISQHKRETIARHSLMDCRTYTCKVQSNSLSNKQKEQLMMMFIEAKWLKNYIINWSKIEGNDIWQFNTKIKNITHKDKDMNDVPVELKYIGSQIKQQVVQQIKSNIKTISTLKKKGYQHNGGSLTYCKEYTSLSLPQYGITYSIKNNRVKIQGIKKTVKINGLEQFINKPNIEITNGKLLNKPDGYYIQFTVFEPKETKEYTKDIIGIDFGCSTTLTLSTGEKFNVSIPESDRLKLLQKKLARQVRLSKNWYKTKNKIKIEYQHISNIKNDKTKKFIHSLKDYSHIVIQDEQIHKWHKGLFGKTVQHSILGRIKSRLKSMDNVTVISKWEPTTKLCPNCGQINKISLTQRVYKCDCGYSCDRDIHSANNMIWFYKNRYSVPTEHRDIKPVEMESICATDNDINSTQVLSMEAGNYTPLGVW